MHGGTIDAASSGLGQASTFTLRLPPMIVHPTSRHESERVHPAAANDMQRIPTGDPNSVHVVAVDADAMSTMVGGLIAVWLGADERSESGDVDGDGTAPMKRRDRFGGLLPEYERAA